MSAEDEEATVSSDGRRSGTCLAESLVRVPASAPPSPNFNVEKKIESGWRASVCEVLSSTLKLGEGGRGNEKKRKVLLN